MYDISDLEFDPAERNRRFAEMRATPGLVRDDANDVYYVARHADVSHASHHPAEFSNAGGVTYFESTPLSFVTMDDPEHGRLRRIVSRQFTPKMVTLLRERTAAYVEERIDATDRTAPVDVVSSIIAPATPPPADCICCRQIPTPGPH
jgi:cytochrome P450